MSISPIPAFDDNYIWCLSATDHAWVVDPGDGDAAAAYLLEQGLELGGVLITHHHSDHVAGVATLKRHWPDAEVVVPVNSPFQGGTQTVSEGSRILLEGLHQIATVTLCPGHTLDHCAYQVGHHLFCGDTLFSGGCGRLFEGSAEQMHDSLHKLRMLGASTLLYPAHEYTLANLAFAQAVEPDNEQLQAYQLRCSKLRQDGIPTLPTSMANELAINPFLRSHLPQVQAAAERHSGHPCQDSLACFTQLRAWKDRF
ncbi:hydroxyacylglutathione hydrolase [Ferrimonas sediminicola]|uniref:Hydroxyacylglutathione hydrolase n=1 Tax=Ferrimonas sediminicola TaxID=2569538 RepID=A0A4U1BEZ9_9GAMM|nr:hydroxyacylglutathione hydrolase [Ferrimonas sediminicola]